MKHLTIFLTILIISACSKNNIEPEPQYLPDWTEIKVKSDNISFFDIYFSNDNFGLICGSSGTLLKTTDGGTTWQKMELGTNATFYVTFILNENTFAAGGSSLFVSKDKGNSFSEYTIPQKEEAIYDVIFINKQVWLIIVNGSLYKTSDAGMNWNVVFNFPSYLFRMQFTSSKTGYAFGGATYYIYTDGVDSEGLLCKTTDNGDTWVELNDSNITSSELKGIFFINDTVGYFTNYLRQIYKTTDGGNNWAYVNTFEEWSRDLLFTNEDKGYYTTSQGKIYKTIDGGVNWEIDLDLDSLQLSFSKIINTENYLYLLNEDGSVFKKSIE